jgi:hypothetical protein
LSLEKRIRRLVLAFRSVGLDTIWSCEGHLDWKPEIYDLKKHSKKLGSYPWIDISGLRGWRVSWDSGEREQESVSYALEIIKDYNKQNKVPWEILEGSSYPNSYTVLPERGTNTKHGLSRLRKSADELAEFIFEKIISKTPIRRLRQNPYIWLPGQKALREYEKHVGQGYKIDKHFIWWIKEFHYYDMVRGRAIKQEI